MTFDENICARNWGLKLDSLSDGIPVLEKDRTLMELKVTGAMPLWMSHLLTEQWIYPASFSKYGEAYRKLLSSCCLPDGRLGRMEELRYG